jgi:Organic solute transport protein 1
MLFFVCISVLHDIILTMLNRKFLDELFRPQQVYPKKSLRTLFERLAHSSIMRLNATSMDKVTAIMEIFALLLSIALQV